MKNKCPKCDVELEENQTICPNCGAELNNQDTDKLREEGNETTEEVVNDNIQWSEYQDVPLESVMEHFSDLSEENDEQEREENSILSEYIRQHKETQFSANESEEIPLKQEAEQPIIEETKELESSTENDTDNSDIEPVSLANDEQNEQIELDTDLEEKSIDEPTFQEPKSEKKSKKKLYGIAAAVIVLVGGSGWLYIDHQQKVEAARQEQLRIENAMSEIENELKAFFVDEDQQFIVSGKTSEDITAVMQELKKYPDEEKYEELNTLGQKIQIKVAVLEKLNGYFTAPIIVGDQLQKNVHIKEGQSVDMALLTEDNAFATLVNQAIEQGKKEYESLQVANKSAEALLAGYQGGKLSDAVSRKDYEATKEQVDALFDGEEKETLLLQIKPVEEAITQREAEQKAAEEKAAQELAAAQAQAEAEAQAAQAQQSSSSTSYSDGQEILSRSTPKNKNNQPIISSRQSDIDDVNNSAWDWAPGVYDKIIQTSINRGYIVEGGYTLERVRIENGEGYYNLYATNTKSSLMSGISTDALPMYLFTVNCKTGFFRGNGND